MRIGAAFPSTYLKAADLQGRQVTVTISHIKLEEVGGERLGVHRLRVHRLRVHRHEPSSRRG